MWLQKSELSSRVFTDTTEAEAALSLSNNYLSQAQKAKVALVIPTYNEKENIAGIISAVFNILPNADVVVVDDRSPDGTADIVRSLADRNQRLHFISREGEKGLGLAYIAGFKHVLQQLNVDYVFEMDADLSHNPKYLPVFLEYAKEYALVSGSRFLHRVSIKNRALWRNFISLTTKWLVNKLIGIGLTDVTTGFRCYQAKALAGLELDKIQSKGYAFQIEILSLVKQKGFAVKELPILFVERTKGSSKLSFGVILEGLCLVLRLAWRKLKR
jgi:dolichol-phosphate mannosyltransferase